MKGKVRAELELQRACLTWLMLMKNLSERSCQGLFELLLKIVFARRQIRFGSSAPYGLVCALDLHARSPHILSCCTTALITGATHEHEDVSDRIKVAHA